MKTAWTAPLIFWQQGSRQQPKNVAVFIFLLLGMIGTIKLVTAGHNLLLTLAGFATRLAQASAEWSPLVKGALAAVLLIEAVFFVYATLRYNALNRPVTKYPDPKRVATTIARFCDLKPVFALEEFLEGWFFGRPITSIPRDNIEEFVAYGFYCLPPDRLSEEQRQKMDAFLEHAVERWGIQVSDGHDPSLKFMAHAWEPMRVHHKPLMAYLAAELVAKTAHMFLRLMGFRKADHGCITCWTAVPKAHSSDSKQVDDNESHPKNTITKTKTNDSTPNTKKCASGKAPNASNTLSATKAELNILHGNQRHHDTLDFDEATERKHGKTLEAAHIAAEHAIDAAVAATSAAAAAMTQQYPHEGQQYHVHHLASTPSGPTTVPSPPHLSPTSSFGEEEKQQLMSIPVHEVSPNENGLQPGGSSTSLVPIVFLHGVGFGVLPYLHFIRDVMKACPASPVIVLEMPHVALRLCKEAAEIDAVAECAVNALKRLGAEKACFVGHSYGTFVISRILQLYPQNVDSVALMDPVCLLTCYPQLLYNFIYRRLSLATLTSPLGIFDAARFVCSRDLTISEAFCRKFHWSELMLWPQDLPDKSNCALICLSGRDDLVPSEMALRQYNGHRGVRLMYHPHVCMKIFLIPNENLLTYIAEAVLFSLHKPEQFSRQACEMNELINPAPIVYERKEANRRTPPAPQALDDNAREPIDSLEIFEHIRDITDPEHPYSLEQLNVVSEEAIEVNDDAGTVAVQFTPTVEHCSMATLIGLCIRVKLLRALPRRFKVGISLAPGSHASEAAVNKQLNDKERVAAALENPSLSAMVDRCLNGDDETAIDEL